MSRTKHNNTKSKAPFGSFGASLGIHYLTVALRSILKDKAYSIVNTVGLAVAVACCFLLIFWIKFEWSYDTMYPKADRIYQVLQVEKRNDGLNKSPEIRSGIVNPLKKTFPEIEAAAMFRREHLPFRCHDDDEGIMVDYMTATADFFDLFTYEFVEGSAEKALKEHGGILSEETAKKFFGKESAIGETLMYSDNFLHITISAVVKMPVNTSIKFDLLNIDDDNHLYGGVHYILVNEKAVFTEETQLKLAGFLSGIRDTKNKLAFMPLKDVHLKSSPESLQQIHLCSLAALLMLLIAIINYVNTSTARAMSRVKEVGVRKVAGSTHRQLIVRFLSESFIISAAAIVVSLGLTKLFFAGFSEIMGTRAFFSFDLNTLLIALVVCIVISFLSGGYAAFYLSSFNPITAFHGGVRSGSKQGLRKVLIGVQFFLSIFILTCTLFMYKQINFMFNMSTGMDRDNIIVLETNLWYKAEDFIQIIKKENPNIIDASLAMNAPYNAYYDQIGVSWEGAKEEVQEITFGRIFCDSHYANTFGLQVIQGEFIPPINWFQDSTESKFNIVINETFKKLMGIENPIGMSVEGTSGKIIGVVKDFNFKPLKEKISPLILCFNLEACFAVFIKTTGQDKAETLQYILSKYKELQPDYTHRPVMYHTVEDEYNYMYAVEIRTAKILLVFSIFSLLLSVMGIVSMISFMVEKRSKEIALRKINGAVAKDIIRLFLKDFRNVAVLSAGVAILASFAVMQYWLQNYVYRTPLSWWILVSVPVAIFLITGIVIALQVSFTTRQNPVDALKKE